MRGFVPALACVLAIPAFALAYPPATVTDVAQTSVKIGGLDCGTQYRIRIEERNSTNTGWGSPTTHIPTTAACISPPSALFPDDLPAGARLVRRDDFENLTLGQNMPDSQNIGQCEPNNNRVELDPYGGGFGKVWHPWWDPGDPPWAAHPVRCETRGSNVHGGEAVYRLVFAVPADSWLTTPGDGSWHQRWQLHGSNPSTSPPISMFVRKESAARFQLRFQAGDSEWSQTPWFGSYPRDTWIGMQAHVRWTNQSSGFARFWINGQPITTNNGTTTFTGPTFRRQQQGTPTGVYMQYGVDAGGCCTITQRVHGYNALNEAYSLP